MPDSLAEELKPFRMRFGAITGWIFAGEGKPDQSMDRHLFDKWLHVAEHRSVLVDSGRIVQVSGPDLDVAASIVIDGRGRTLMPGLIDSHHAPWCARHRTRERRAQ